MEKTNIRRIRQQLSVMIAGFGMLALLHPVGALAASSADLCATMLNEIRSLVREIQTDCTVQSRAEGQDLAFNTDYRAFADNHQARSYLLYVFGSAGRMLNRRQAPAIRAVTLTDDALTRQGMRFSIGAAELRRLQSAASSGALSMNSFHTELLRTGKFDRD